MKIAFFHPSLRVVGGAEVLLARQARYLRGEGLDVCVATEAYEPRSLRQLLDGVPVRIAKRTPWREWVTRSAEAKLKSQAGRARMQLSDRDVVIAHNHPCSVQLAMAEIPASKIWYCNEPPRYLHLVQANPRLSQRVASIARGSSEAEKEYSRTLARYRRKLRSDPRLSEARELDMRQANRIGTILVNSEFTRDNVKRIYDRGDAEIVYPIIPFDEPAGTRIGLDRRGLNVLVHSRLETVKNIDTLLRAFALFLRSEPNARLHVVGVGAAGRRLKRLVRTLRIAHAVRFHGFLPPRELRSIYEACDVFALLPIDEPFGMVFAEAAARGLLLIGPDHGGPLEILDGGKLGWICDPFDVESIADAFGRVWRLSDSEAQRKREEAARASHARFSEAVLGPKLRRIVARSPAAVQGEAI